MSGFLQNLTRVYPSHPPQAPSVLCFQFRAVGRSEKPRGRVAMWWIYSTPGWNRVNRSAKNWGGGSLPACPFSVYGPASEWKSSKSSLFKKFPLEKQSKSPLRPAIEKRLNEHTRAFFNLSIKFSELIGNPESSLRLRQIEQTFVVFLGSVGY